MTLRKLLDRLTGATERRLERRIRDMTAEAEDGDRQIEDLCAESQRIAAALGLDTSGDHDLVEAVKALVAERDRLLEEVDQSRANRPAASQPPPTPGDGDIWAELIAELPAHSPLLPHYIARRQLGINHYGVPLQRNNGRDMLIDLFEELLDATAYAWGCEQYFLAEYLAEKAEQIEDIIIWPTSKDGR